jgi:hypothetical protein
LFKSGFFGLGFSTIVDFFQFCWRYVADGSKEPAMAEIMKHWHSGQNVMPDETSPRLLGGWS